MNECSFCNNLIVFEYGCRLSACGHVFHKKCIVEWILSSRTCPTCRKPCHPGQTFKIVLELPNKDDGRYLAAIQSTLQKRKCTLQHTGTGDSNFGPQSKMAKTVEQLSGL